MKKIIFLVLILVIGFGFYRLLSQKPTVPSVNSSNADIVLFWGDGCPHCATLEKYIKDNNYDSKVKIDRKEVWYNKTNQELLKQTAANCPEVDTSQGVGVPFAYITSSKKCLVGDQPVIDWLKTNK